MAQGNYTDWFNSTALLCGIEPDDPNFVAIMPSCRTYAEGRIYRELNMLVANVRDASAVCTPGSRNFNLPTGVGTFLIVTGLNIITPAGASADTGTRVPLESVSQDFLDYSWPSVTGTGVPQYFSYFTQNTYNPGGQPQNQIAFGPWPDQAYTVEVVGKIQPAPMSESNPNTFLTDYLFDVLQAASMIYMAGYQQNFGLQSDNPQQAQSWSAQYDELMKSAGVQEARKRFAGPGWTPTMPEPLAGSPRT